MSLAKADSDDYTEVGSFTTPGSGERPSWSHPVIVGGKLYLREQDGSSATIYGPSVKWFAYGGRPGTRVA